MFKYIVSAVLDFIYPHTCDKCNSLFTVESNPLFCDKCLNENIEYILPPYCFVCGRKVGDNFNDISAEKILCRDCRKSAIYFNSLRSVVFYESVIKDLIHYYKYNKFTNLKNFFSRFILKYLKENNFYFDKKFDFIIPVPLHKNKLKQRGFNQSFLICENIGKNLNIPVLDNYLIRIKETKSQFNLKRTERIENIKNAFGLNETKDIKILNGKNILLIDDVSTTNITINECSRTLITKCLVNRVDAITIAHGK